MKKTRLILLTSALLCVALTFSSCKKDISSAPSATTSADSKLKSTNISEGFETGTKTAYAAASVTLSSGSWNLSDALIGTSSSDSKNGLKSVRIRNSGTITMLFDKAGGAGTVTINHALYGSDASSTWELWFSTNSGSSWTKTGSTITTSSTTLSSASFTVNVDGSIRFEIRKTDGTSNRINFDDISIIDYSSGSTGGGSTGGGTTTTFVENNNMAFGNPSGATTSTLNANNYLMTKSQYSMSYSNSKHTTNWTSWHLASTDIGSAARQDDFRADTSLPSGWYQVGGSEYSGSGFDRGHMCPSADRTSSVANNSATFLMTNMIPQAPKNNQVTWANLETYSRTLVSAGNELYIICGPYGQGGAGSNGAASTIGNGIVVPAKTWKVILVLSSGSSDLSRVTTSTRVIAVLMPNDQTASSKPWGDYRVSIDSIEALTGYDFFTNVSTSIQSVLESKVDTGATI